MPADKRARDDLCYTVDYLEVATSDDHQYDWHVIPPKVEPYEGPLPASSCSYRLADHEWITSSFGFGSIVFSAAFLHNFHRMEISDPDLHSGTGPSRTKRPLPSAAGFGSLLGHIVTTHALSFLRSSTRSG